MQAMYRWETPVYLRALTCLCPYQCVDGGGGGGGGEGGALNFFASFWSNSQPLGLENNSNLIKYPHLGMTKPYNDMYKK